LSLVCPRYLGSWGHSTDNALLGYVKLAISEKGELNGVFGRATLVCAKSSTSSRVADMPFRIRQKLFSPRTLYLIRLSPWACSSCCMLVARNSHGKLISSDTTPLQFSQPFRTSTFIRRLTIIVVHTGLLTAIFSVVTLVVVRVCLFRSASTS
jgi:hypothetical protein